MKSLEEINEIFTHFENSSDQFYEIQKGTNWTIAAFRPFERKNKTVYSFRLYGEITDSKFVEYNNKQQWCGGVDYYLDIKINKLERFEYEHKLHDVIRKKINVSELLQKI